MVIALGNIVSRCKRGTQSNTFILPITPQIELIYDFVPFIRLTGDAEFDTVRWFEKQLDAGFVFSGIGKYENIYGQQIPIQHNAYYILIQLEGLD